MLRLMTGAGTLDRKSLGLPEGARLRVYRAHTRAGQATTTAIVIPARNEEKRIEECLRALVRQRQIARSQISIVLVANNCADATVERAVAVAQKTNLDLWIVDFTLAGAGGPGLARRAGCSLALTAQPDISYILTTDADCIADDLWVHACLHHLSATDVVCGQVMPDPDEYMRLPQRLRADMAIEHDYLQATLEFLSLVRPDPLNPWPHHGHASGANLGFRREAYLSSGGFCDVECGEDREIVRASKAAGLTVVHTYDAKVTASCRLVGRAKGGMADTLSGRIADPDSLADHALSPANLIMSQSLAAATRDSMTTNTFASDRHQLRPADLLSEIDRLRDVIRILRGTSLEGRLHRLVGLVTTIDDTWPYRLGRVR